MALTETREGKTIRSQRKDPVHCVEAVAAVCGWWGQLKGLTIACIVSRYKEGIWLLQYRFSISAV